jgi:phage tail-like protein
MANALRIDPLGVYNFYLTLLDSQNTVGTLITAAVNYFVAGFSECSGMDATIEVMDFKEGGLNSHVWKFPTRASHSNITLKHGAIYLYDDLWSWHYDWVQGKGTRKDGLIVLKDNAGRPAKIWKFKRGIPVKWSGPALNASQNNVAIESLEIAHEGLVMTLGA